MEIILKNEYSEKWIKLLLDNKCKIVNFKGDVIFEPICFSQLLTNEIVLKNPNEKWDWDFLRRCNKNIITNKPLTKNDYCEEHFLPVVCYWNEDLDVIYDYKHPLNLSLAEIIENIETCFDEGLGIRKKIYWKYLSLNQNLTLKLIKNNLDKPWYWYNICFCNPENDCKNYIKNGTKKILLTQILKCKKLNINKPIIKHNAMPIIKSYCFKMITYVA